MITIRPEGIDNLKNMFDGIIVNAAAFSGVIRTVNAGRTLVSSAVRESYNIKKSDFDKRIRLIYPKDYSRIEGAIEISGGIDGSDRSSIPLIYFGAKGYANVAGRAVKTTKGKNGYYSIMLKRSKKEGVSHKVLKSGGVGFSRNAFIIPGGKGSLQVVRRISGVKGNKGLKEMKTLSPASMVASKGHGVIKRIEQQLQDRFKREVTHQLDYYLNRAAAGQLIGGSGWNVGNQHSYRRMR